MILEDNAPSVKVKCPAIKCSFNVKGWCGGRPWIDMSLVVDSVTDVERVRCLDYVNEEELQGE